MSSGYVRRARHRWPAVLTLGLLALVGVYALSLLLSGQSAGPLEAVRLRALDQTSSPLYIAVEWIRGRVSSVRFGINGALPFGPFVTILKLAICAVAATVFLRGPRGT